MQKFTDVQGTANARMNLDASPEVIPNGMMREIMHMVDDGRGQLVNMKGFENVMTMEVNTGFTMPAGAFKCVGTAKDIENSQIIYFLCDTVGTAHSILSMNTDTKVLTWVLKDEPILALRSNWRVDADVIEGLLSWTFGYFGSFLNNDFNPPRKINIAKAKKYTAAKEGRWEFTQVQEAWHATGIKAWEGMTTYIGTTPYPYTGTETLGAWSLDDINRVKPSAGIGVIWDMRIIGGLYYVTIDRQWNGSTYGPISLEGYLLEYTHEMYLGVDWEALDIIQYCPTIRPEVSYGSDASRETNNLYNSLFQFAYRWIMSDNEKTVFSSISDVAIPTSTDSLNGSHGTDPTIDNKIDVTYNTGGPNVKAIELIVRKNNIGPWFIVKRDEKFDRDGNRLVDNDITNTFSFYNTEAYETIDQSDVSRIEDFVPFICGSEEVIEKNRIVYGNYTEGFDNIDVSASLSLDQQEVNVGKIGSRIDGAGQGMWGALLNIGAMDVEFKYYGGRVEIGEIFEAGFTYVIRVSFSPGRYNNPEGWSSSGGLGGVGGNIDEFLQLTYNEFYNKTISAQATVVTNDTTTLQTFMDDVVNQLRAGTSTAKVIGLNNYSYKTFGIYHTLYDYQYGFGNPLLSNTQFGFIVEYAGPYGDDWRSCVNWQYMDVEVLKISDTQVVQSFKSGAYHDFGIVYLDRAGRRSAVNKSDDLKIYVPPQSNGNVHNILQNTISMSVAHIPPAEAVYWQPVYAGNTSISYYLFASIQSISNKPKTPNVAASNCTLICINEYIVQTNEAFTKFVVDPYEWKSGDRIRFVFYRNAKDEFKTTTNVIDKEILGVYWTEGNDGYEYDTSDSPAPITDANGNKVRSVRGTTLLIDKIDYTALGISADTCIVEVYRPKEVGDTIIYNDFGPTLPVLSPNTSERRHGGTVNQVLSGGKSIVSARVDFDKGDTYLAFRNMVNAFPCERSNYSDFFDSSAYGKGKPNVSNPNMHFDSYVANLRYGGRLIQDTRVNDMSRFLASDTVELKDKYGAVYSLEEVGDVLKVHQKSKVSSLLIGRAGVTQPNEEGTQIISSTKDVLGTLVVPASNYGTVHPGSVVASPTRNYFFDFYANSLIRDAGNGHQNLTELYGLKQFMASMCRQWGTPDNVSVIGGWDQENSLVWWTFDSDSASFSLAFRDNGGVNEDGFACFGMFIPDQYGMSKYTATAFKDNALWLMNSDNVARCNFFGEQFTYWLTPVFNKGPVTMKRWLQILLSTAKKFAAPNAGDVEVPISGNSPAGMVSLLKSAAFTPVNGKMVADFGKNMTTNSLTPTNADLVNGDDLTGQCLTVRLEGSETTEHKIMAVEVIGIA